jgi:outer membrane protein TolC
MMIKNKHMNFKNCVLIASLLLGITGYSQENSTQYSLQQAIDFAMQNNKQLQNAKDDIAIADEQYKEARAPGLPKVEGTFDYMTNFNYEFEFGFGGSGTVDQNTLSQAMQSTMADYPTWTMDDILDYQASQAFEQKVQSLMPASTIVMEDQSNATLQVSQLIFSGQYWIGLQMAKLGKSVRNTSLTISELDVKEQVTNSYYLVLMTQNLLEVLDKNIENLQDVYEHTNTMLKMGVVEQTDVDQIKINVSQLQNSKMEMQRNLELNINMFRLVLGLESGTEVQLTNTLEEFVSQVKKNTLNIGDLNLENNPNYQIMNMQENLGNEQVKLHKWAYAPVLVGFYQYKEKLMTTAFDMSPNHAAGLTLSIPIFAGGEKKAKLSQKKIELDKIQRNKELLADQLNLQHKQLNFEYSSAFSNYLTQKENVEVANRVYKSYQNKYKQGTISSLELTQANSNYLQAESTYVSSVLKLLQAKLAIEKLHNTL